MQFWQVMCILLTGPFIGEHGVDREIFEMVVEPLGLTGYAF